MSHLNHFGLVPLDACCGLALGSRCLLVFKVKLGLQLSDLSFKPAVLQLDCNSFLDLLSLFLYILLLGTPTSAHFLFKLFNHLPGRYVLPQQLSDTLYRLQRRLYLVTP